MSKAKRPDLTNANANPWPFPSGNSDAKDSTDCLASGRIEIRATAEKLKNARQAALGFACVAEDLQTAWDRLERASDEFEEAQKRYEEAKKTLKENFS